MSDLIKYNEKLVPKGNGFINLGATCYHNSILQCLLSCTSIFQTLEKNIKKEHIFKNPLVQNMLKLHRESLNGKNVNNLCVPIWKDIMNISRSRQDNVRFNSGQQDAHEGLMLFLDVCDTIPEIKRLFEHRHRIRILCDKCQKWVVDRFETNLTFDVQSDLKTEQHLKFKNIDEYYNTSMPLNEFLRNQNGYVDENYICPNPDCKEKGFKYKTTTLTMIPEILPILIKKYKNKQVTPFPNSLEFLAKGKSEKLIYKLVAQSEHSGTISSGHYWAICKRSDGWKNLNDTSVNDGQPGPTPYTYVLFYHFDGTVKL